MKRKQVFRGLQAMMLAVALFFCSLPVRAISAAPASEFRRITALEELTTGSYVLVLSNGYAPSALQEDWITSVRIQVSGDTIADVGGAVWFLQVEGGTVALQDSSGTTLIPEKDGENGISAGEGSWSVRCSEGLFSFHSFSDEAPVTLAANKNMGYWFRAYRDSTIAQGPEGYPSRFALYRMEQLQLSEQIPAAATEAPETTESTEGHTETTAATQPPETTASPLPETEPTQSQTEPAQPEQIVAPVTMTPEGGARAPGEAVALCCATEGAVIFYALSTDGQTYSEYTAYTAPIVTDGNLGTLYVKAYAEKEGFTGSSETLGIFTQTFSRDWNVYFGQLHAHCSLSDGFGDVEDAFCYASEVEGLDFFALTDHSNSFDNALAGAIGTDSSLVSAEWAAGKAAASAVTDDDFVGIFGYEMTWQEDKQLGHINTFATPGFTSREQEAYCDRNTALENYYAALATVPGSIGQFNHPGELYGDFQDFAHLCPEYDTVMTLLEVGGEGGFTAYDAYIRALDLGWHVAPANNQNNHNGRWGDAGDSRTVVLAKELTEEAVYDAMGNYRVYATGDSDLTIYYLLNGSIMGSILPASELAQIQVFLSDPTDAVGTVAVIADGGKVLAEQSMEENAGNLTFSLPGSYSYYFLRITQPDGDIAVTAPVWLDRAEDMGIGSFSADTAVPVRDQALSLTLELYNRETVDFLLEKVEFTVDGQVIHSVSAPGALAPGDTLAHTFSYTHPGLGVTQICAVVTGTVAGEPRTYTQTLTLRYRMEEAVNGIAVDDLHGGIAGSMSNLTDLAAGQQICVKPLSLGGMALLEESRLLVVFCPETAFSGEYLTQVWEFVKNGGSVVVCGAGTEHSSGGAEELNRLLSGMGVSLKLTGSAVSDEQNSGENGAIITQVYNDASPWCKEIKQEQCYYQSSGCAVDPGSGTWLVKALPTTYIADGESPVLLACEDTPWGGTVFVSGGTFLSNGDMPRQESYWDAVSVNQSILERILDIRRTELPLTAIAQVRSAEPGEVFRIRGYVTAGTANRCNTFPETIYLQDDTGGIAVSSFTQTGIEVGTPMEVIGYLSYQGGNPVLELIDYTVTQDPLYRYVPRSTNHKEAMDYSANGGKLMEVEGWVVDAEYTPDGEGVRRFTVKDGKGDLAQVFIEEGIFAGSTGKNTLASQVKKGKTVRAMGILHLDETGTPVLRVRNCEEVVYVPPVVTPDTGDRIVPGGVVLVLTGAMLAAVPIKKKTRRS